MADVDSNEAIWKSAETIKRWASEQRQREEKRSEELAFIAALLPFEPDEAFTVADLGAGTGMAARAVLDHYPNAQAILADFSPAMMGEGEKSLAAYEGRYRYIEFDLRSSEWPAGMPKSLDAVLTSQCVHHLPDERKTSLTREIFERLKPGGWYVNYDPVKALDPKVEHVWERVNDRFDPGLAQRRSHRSPKEHAQWENHVRHMTDLEQQLRNLRSAGFEAVDVYWKRLDYTICGGCKPR
ncbi:MAG: methyltransferase domain-containing protein [Chloroflexi bacterium]|nr:methyltransferase domain-containing protein [Chloroflexota bacterium]